jgi:hypothetical protein
LPRREDKDAGEVVVIPRHFLFGEEADDLAPRLLDRGDVRIWVDGRGRWGVDEKVVFEAGDVEEDGLVVEEELCEEREVLAEELRVSELVGCLQIGR